MQNELICERIGISKQKKKFFDVPSLALTCKKSMKKRQSFAANNIHTLHLYFSPFKLSFFISISLSIPSSLSFPLECSSTLLVKLTVYPSRLPLKQLLLLTYHLLFRFLFFFFTAWITLIVIFFICMVSKPFSPTENWFPFPYPIRLSVNIVIFSICTRLKNNHVFSACLTRDF